MKQSGFGIASFVLGIIGMILSIVLVGVVPCVLALVFGVIATRKKDKKHGLAIAGIVCSVLGILVFGLIVKPDPKPKTVNMELGVKESINDLFEFTPEKGCWRGVVYPSNSSLRDYAYTVDEGEMPYLLTGTLKNIGTEEYDVDWVINADMTINDTYEFDAEVRVESRDGKDFEYILKPLQERKFYIYAKIPYEVYDVFEKCEIELTFSTDGKASAWARGERHTIYKIELDKEESKPI